MCKLKMITLGLVIAAIFGLTACSAATAIPHPTDGRSDCLACHGSASSHPYPKGHASKNYTNQRCIECHKTAAATEK
jgi:hypothetical protein